MAAFKRRPLWFSFNSNRWFSQLSGCHRDAPARAPTNKPPSFSLYRPWGTCQHRRSDLFISLPLQPIAVCLFSFRRAAHHFAYSNHFTEAFQRVVIDISSYFFKTRKWITHPGKGRNLWLSSLSSSLRHRKGKGFIWSTAWLQLFSLKHLWCYTVQREFLKWATETVHYKKKLRYGHSWGFLHLRQISAEAYT